MEDPSTNKAIAMLLAGYPDRAVLIWKDGSAYRAGLMTKPMAGNAPNQSSECRPDPHTAVLRLRTMQIELAQKGCNTTQEHLCALTRSPFAEPIQCRHYYSGALQRCCLDCSSPSEGVAK